MRIALAGACTTAQPDVRARQMSEEEHVAAEVASMRAALVAAFGAGQAGDPDEEMVREAWHAAHIDVVGPDTLLASQPWTGTHSVIDMTGVADRPEGGRGAPLPDEELDRWFESGRPDVAAVERVLADGLSGFARWHGTCVVAYAGDDPELIYFFGWSGD